jgi:hypothetical protein
VKFSEIPFFSWLSPTRPNDLFAQPFLRPGFIHVIVTFMGVGVVLFSLIPKHVVSEEMK